jgi:hypothetical protein
MPFSSQNTSAADEFIAKLKNLGHPEYPVLNRKYSPSSRVPCTDLVPFITEMLREGNLPSIKKIMRAVIEANPGLGIGVDVSWIDERIENVVPTHLDKYVLFQSDPTAIDQLRALFIIAEKEGSGREFWITVDIPRLFSRALIAYRPKWSHLSEELVQRANKWIEKMAKNTPYWQNYPKFEATSSFPCPEPGTAQAKVQGLSPAARLQLFYALERGGGPLETLTNYAIRSFGIDVVQTSRELIESQLLIHSESAEALESALTKQDLLVLCESRGTNFRKSWKRGKLLEALTETDVGLIKVLAREKGLVGVNPVYSSELAILADRAELQLGAFKLLCFA